MIVTGQGPARKLQSAPSLARVSVACLRGESSHVVCAKLTAVRLDFWFDLSCPYAYLASQRLGEVLSGRPVDLRYRPMLLGGVFREIGAGDGPMATLSDAKRANLARDLARWAAVAGVPLETPAAHPMRTVRALRTLLGLPEPSWPAATHALFAAYWQRGEDITQDEVIAAALTGAGVPATAVRRRHHAG